MVVDNDDVAARLMKELAKANAGRVTFMPLNRLRPGANYTCELWVTALGEGGGGAALLDVGAFTAATTGYSFLDGGALAEIRARRRAAQEEKRKAAEAEKKAKQAEENERIRAMARSNTGANPSVQSMSKYASKSRPQKEGGGSSGRSGVVARHRHEAAGGSSRGLTAAATFDAVFTRPQRALSRWPFSSGVGGAGWLAARRPNFLVASNSAARLLASRRSRAAGTLPAMCSGRLVSAFAAASRE